MSTRYYVEERPLSGPTKWISKIYNQADGKPPVEKRGPDMRNRVFRKTPVEIPAVFNHLTVGQLEELFSPDGRFYSAHVQDSKTRDTKTKTKEVSTS